jgi:hypothetical protein
MDCEVPGCGKPGANPHHLIYKNEKTRTKDYVIFLCPPHHKLVTKTAFLKTMDMLFEDHWREYKDFIRQQKSSD